MHWQPEVLKAPLKQRGCRGMLIYAHLLQKPPGVLCGLTSAAEQPKEPNLLITSPMGSLGLNLPGEISGICAEYLELSMAERSSRLGLVAMARREAPTMRPAAQVRCGTRKEAKCL